MSEEITLFKEREVPEGFSTVNLTNTYENGMCKIGFEIRCNRCGKRIIIPKLITQHGRLICPCCHEDL